MLVLLQFAQLTPQLAAETDSLRFLSKKGIYSLTYAGETWFDPYFTWFGPYFTWFGLYFTCRLCCFCLTYFSVFFLSFFCLFSVFFLSFFCLFSVFLLSFYCLFPVIFLSFHCLFTVFFYLILLTHIRNHLFSIPILYHFTALCIEKVGLTSFSWVLYAMIEKLACVKIVKAISEKSQQNQQDNKNDSFVVARNISFSVITEKENEIEDEFRSASTTGTTVINPYIIKTPTYSVWEQWKDNPWRYIFGI